MPPSTIELPDDPDSALEQLRSASATGPVAVFKLSPICPISTRAESSFERFIDDSGDALAGVARIDVIARRALARGLTAGLGIAHESPQLLWFRGGRLGWHGSHGDITEEQCRRLLEQ